MTNGKIIAEYQDLKNIADAVRDFSGVQEDMWIVDIPDKIRTFTGGINTLDATATAEDIVVDKIAYSQNQRLIGTNPYSKSATDAAVSTQSDLINLINMELDERGEEENEEYTKISTGTLAKNNDSLEILLTKAQALPTRDEQVKLPALENEGTAADLLQGKQLIDGEGNIVTGIIETKNAEGLSVNGPAVSVSAGYYPNNVMKSVQVIASLNLAPSIHVDALGNISSTMDLSEGYYYDQELSAARQLNTQNAVAITPTKSPQVAVAANKYTLGEVTVNPIPSEYITTTGADITPETVFYNKKGYANGSLVTGTFSIDSELSEQNTLISQLENALLEKVNPNTEEWVFTLEDGSTVSKEVYTKWT